MRDIQGFVAAMLGAIGLEYVPPKERVTSGWKSHFRPLNMERYYVDYHGTIHRKDKKRDKSISPRQWKLHKKAARRAVAAQIKAREQDACTQEQF